MPGFIHFKTNKLMRIISIKVFLIGCQYKKDELQRKQYQKVSLKNDGILATKKLS